MWPVTPVDIAVAEGHPQAFMPLPFPDHPWLGNFRNHRGVGPGRTRFRTGRCGTRGHPGVHGAFAEYVVLKASAIVRKPAGMSFAEAAALPIAAATAIAALDACEVGAGTKLLIHAASGGVGSIAVQIAKARGAEVTALVPGNSGFRAIARRRPGC